MKHLIKSLPYEEGALEPHMSRTTLMYHHGKHLAAYVNNLNNLTAGTQFEDMSLEDIIRKSDGAIFNNAAQVWNHNFFFDQFAKDPQVAPQGALLGAIELSFGSFGAFKEQFATAALALFGSGWVWLVRDGSNELTISPMSNAATPIRDRATPIFTCDVWEHAYYIDNFNNRADYLVRFWECVDWRKIEQRFVSPRIG